MATYPNSPLPLPTEIISIILSFINNPNDDNAVWPTHSTRRKTLHALCLTSRAFSVHCTPLLYNWIHWIWKTGSPSDIHPDEYPPLHLLLRTLLTRPDLRELVHEIHFEGWNKYSTNYPLKVHEFGEHERSLLCDAISQIISGSGVPYAPPGAAQRTPDALMQEQHLKWTDLVLKIRHSEAIAAVALSLMPNLKKINLVMDYARDVNFGVILSRPYFFACVIIRSPDAVVFNPRLEHIVFDNRQRHPELKSDETRYWVTLRTFANFSQLRGIKSIELRLNDTDVERLTGPLHPRISNPIGSLVPSQTLESLTLVTTKSHQLESLLALAPNLSRLRYTLIRDVTSFDIMVNGNHGSWAQADTLREILLTAPCTKKLKELAVEIFWYASKEPTERDNWGGHLCGITGRLGPLTALENLETLETGMVTLLGARGEEHSDTGGPPPTTDFTSDLVSMLPKGLKKLRISHDWYGFDAEYNWEDEALPGLIEDLLWEPESESKGIGPRVGYLEEVVVYNELQGDPRDPYPYPIARLGPREVEQLRDSCERRGVKFKVEGKRKKGEIFRKRLNKHEE